MIQGILISTYNRYQTFNNQFEQKKEKQDLFFGYMECWKVDVLCYASKKFVALQEENE